MRKPLIKYHKKLINGITANQYISLTLDIGNAPNITADIAKLKATNNTSLPNKTSSGITMKYNSTAYLSIMVMNYRKTYKYCSIDCVILSSRYYIKLQKVWEFFTKTHIPLTLTENNRLIWSSCRIYCHIINF